MRRGWHSAVAVCGGIVAAVFAGCSSDDKAAAPAEKQEVAVEVAATTATQTPVAIVDQEGGDDATGADALAIAGAASKPEVAKVVDETSDESRPAAPPPIPEKIEPVEPLSFTELIALLDLRTDLDILPGAGEVQRSLTDIYYAAPGNIVPAIKFYSTQLVDRGWQLDEKMSVVAGSSHMKFYRKDGSLLMLNIGAVGDDQVSVSIDHFGNINCTALPHPEGATLKNAMMNAASFAVTPAMLTAAAGGDEKLKPADAALAFLRAELPKQGWTEFSEQFSSDSFLGPKVVFFTQRTARLTVYVRSGWGNRSIDYSGSLHGRGLTVIGNATDVTLDDEFGLLKYRTDASAAEVIQHHRDALAVLGWQPMPGGESTGDIGGQLVLNDGSDDCYNVIVLHRSDGADVQISKIDKSDAEELIEKLRADGT